MPSMRSIKRGLGKSFGSSSSSAKDPSSIDVFEEKPDGAAAEARSSARTDGSNIPSPVLFATQPDAADVVAARLGDVTLAKVAGGAPTSPQLIRFAGPPSSPTRPPAAPLAHSETSPERPPRHQRHAAPPSPRRLSPIPSGVGLPLEALREVQHAFSIHPWMLGLPELATFQVGT